MQIVQAQAFSIWKFQAFKPEIKVVEIRPVNMIFALKAP